jgi:hypothetical protein
MQFDVAGPFKLTRHGTKKFITEQTKTDLKPDLEETVSVFLRRVAATFLQSTLARDTRHTMLGKPVSNRC